MNFYKNSQIEKMFNRISPKYYFINHILSFGAYFTWRKKVSLCYLLFLSKKGVRFSIWNRRFSNTTS